MNFGGRRLVPLVPHLSLAQFKCTSTWRAFAGTHFRLKGIDDEALARAVYWAVKDCCRYAATLRRNHPAHGGTPGVHNAPTSPLRKTFQRSPTPSCKSRAILSL